MHDIHKIFIKQISTLGYLVFFSNYFPIARFCALARMHQTSMTILLSRSAALRAYEYIATQQSTTITALPTPFFSLFTEWSAGPTATFILSSAKKRHKSNN